MPWAYSASPNGSPTSSVQTGESWPRTAGSIRRHTAKKPCESLPRRGGNHEVRPSETSECPNSSDYPSQVRPGPETFQGIRKRRGGPDDLRPADEARPPSPQGRVFLLAVGVHGSQR